MARTLLLVSFVSAVLTCLAPHLLLADEIVLDNYTRLTGTVTGLAGNVLTLTSDYAEPIKIKTEHITRISTDNPVELHLVSGEIIKGTLKTGDDGRIVVDQGDGRAATGIDLKRIATINPPPAKKWLGSASLSGSLETGNTEISGLSLGAEGVYRGDNDRFSMRFLYSIGQENHTMDTRNAFGAAQYDYFFTKKFYVYPANVSLYNDTFKNLILRTIAGPGVGYQVWEDPDKTLALEAGISYFNIDRRGQGDQNWITARLAANCRFKLTKWLVFTDRLVLFPSLENANNFLLRNEAALLTPVCTGWSLKLADVLEYVNRPAVGKKSTDSLLTVGLQYAF
jgi:putative salt-induced outer membrane protein YdiY